MDKLRREFKKGLDLEDVKLKRAEGNVQLRKIQRDELLNKKRTKRSDGSSFAICEDDNGPSASSQEPTAEEQARSCRSIQGAAADLQKDSVPLPVYLDAAKRLRSELAKQHFPPIQTVIDSGVVPRVVFLLKVSAGHTQNDEFIIELVWVVTNIAAGSTAQVKVLTDLGVVKVLCGIVSHSAHGDKVCDSVLWALGNIAGDSTQMRDLVLRDGVVSNLAQVMSRQKLTIARNVAWSLSNLTRGKPQPPFELVRNTLPLLATLIYSQDEEVLTDVCWSLGYLSDDSSVNNSKIDAVLSAGVAWRLVELLMHKSIKIKEASLRAVSNILTGTDAQTQVMVRHSALPCLLSMLSYPKKSVRRTACWALSNVTAGTSGQIQAVIDVNAIPALITILKSGEFDVQKEAIHALSNAVSGGTPEQVQYIVAQDLIAPVCDLLKAPDPPTLVVCLKMFEKLLRHADEHKREKLTQLIEQSGGLHNLEELQKHANETIYNETSKLLTRYFRASDNDDNTMSMSMSMSTNMTGGGAFNMNDDAKMKWEF